MRLSSNRRLLVKKWLVLSLFCEPKLYTVYSGHIVLHTLYYYTTIIIVALMRCCWVRFDAWNVNRICEKCFFLLHCVKSATTHQALLTPVTTYSVIIYLLLLTIFWCFLHQYFQQPITRAAAINYPLSTHC